MSWRRVFSGREAFIESKAGAWPPDCAEHEMVTTASVHGMQVVECKRCGWQEHFDWPQEKPPPFAGDDEDDPAPRGDADA